MNLARRIFPKPQHFLVVALLLIVFLPGIAQATSFTSASVCQSSCNWNSGSSWTGGDGTNWPSSSADTATISAGNKVVISSSVTITSGAISLTAGTSTVTGRTTLTVNGTLNLASGLTMNGVHTLAMGPGSVLDLNGNTASTTATDGQYNFSGTSGSHATIQSTGSAGQFMKTGTSQLIST